MSPASLPGLSFCARPDTSDCVLPVGIPVIFSLTGGHAVPGRRKCAWWAFSNVVVRSAKVVVFCVTRSQSWRACTLDWELHQSVSVLPLTGHGWLEWPEIACLSWASSVRFLWSSFSWGQALLRTECSGVFQNGYVSSPPVPFNQEFLLRKYCPGIAEKPEPRVWVPWDLLGAGLIAWQYHIGSGQSSARLFNIQMTIQ